VADRLSPLVARLAVVLLLLAATVAQPAVAGAAPPDAGTASARVASAQRAADAADQRYFARLDDVEKLRSLTGQMEAAVADGERRAATLRKRVQATAARMYVGASAAPVALEEPRDVSELMRRSKLLSVVTGRDNDALRRLKSQNDDLDVQRSRLAALRDQAASALSELDTARRQADARLQSALRDRADVQARLAAQAARDAAAARAAKAATAPKGSPRARAIPVVAPPRAPAPPPVTAPPGGPAGSHHDDPFLVCVRNRESRGNYSVVNPSGPYYGAYQFLQSTWNITARHAGRLDLVGVVPSSASPSDQDDMAWSLYQWQGPGPWGGSC
jgi:hypothetical protein